MPNKNFKILFYLLLAIALSLGLSIALQGILAVTWIEPPASPPSCPDGYPYCYMPLNVSGTGQSKNSGLILNWDDGIPPPVSANGLIVANGNVGIGTINPNELLTLDGVLSLEHQPSPPGGTIDYSKIYMREFTPGNDQYTKLLLHFDGPDGSTANKDFKDSSYKNMKIRPRNGAELDDTWKKFGDTSVRLDASGNSRVWVQDSPSWYFYSKAYDTVIDGTTYYGVIPFAIDFWVRINNLQNTNPFFQQRADSDNLIEFYYDNNSSPKKIVFRVRKGGSNKIVYSRNYTLAANTDYHIILMRGAYFSSGGFPLPIYTYYPNLFSICVNGDCDNAGPNVTEKMPNISSALEIGRVGGNYLNGWLDEFRIQRFPHETEGLVDGQIDRSAFYSYAPPPAPYGNNGFTYVSPDGSVIDFDTIGVTDPEEDVVGGLWQQSGSAIYYEDGFVGVGTPSPNYDLDVAGEIHASDDICTELPSGPGTTCLADAVTIPGGGSADDLYVNVTGDTMSGDLIIEDPVGNASISFTRGGTVIGSVLANTANQLNIQALNQPIRFSADGFTTEHMRITPTGNVGLGIASPDSALEIRRLNSIPTLKLHQQKTASYADGDIVGQLVFDASDADTLESIPPATGVAFIRAVMRTSMQSGNRQTKLEFGNAGPSRNYNITTDTTMVIDYNGNVGIGTAGPQDLLHLAADGYVGLRIVRHQNDTGPAYLNLYHSRGTQASPTIVGNTDALGAIVFAGHDGSAYQTAAYIAGRVDGAPGANDMPGRLEFYTVPDNTTTPQERMRITNTGKVGIGTAGPNYKLDIESADSIQLELNTPTSGGSVGLLFNEEGQNSAYIHHEGQHDSGYLEIEDYSSGWSSTGLVIKQGNVGIGTTNPGAKLDVSGDIKTSGDVYLSNNKAFRVDSASGDTDFRMANYDDGFSFTSGRQSHFTVEGRMNAGKLCLQDDGSGANCLSNWGEIVAAGGGDLWSLSGSNLYPKSTTYKVGIGTVNPGGTGSKLDVVGGSIAVDGQAALSSDASDIKVGDLAGGDGLRNLALRAGDQIRMYITTGGNVGIGTVSPEQKLQVDGASEILSTGSGAGFKFRTRGQGISGNHDFVWYATGSDIARFWTEQSGDVMGITMAGNVGIGTAGPVEKLEVAGAIKSTSALVTASGAGGWLDYTSAGAGNGVRLGSFGPDATTVGTFNFYSAESDNGNGAIRMFIDTAGNVGIGTAGPGAKLDVQGGRIRGQYEGQVNSASVTAGNWYRIASNPGNRANAEFTLRDYISGGGHSTLTFRAGISFNWENGISFTVLNHNYYSTPTFTKVRILESSTYDPQYLEVYIARTGGVDYSIYDNLQSGGWTPVAWTPGSVPPGYNAREYDVNKLFVVGDNDDRLTVNYGGNVGIGTVGPNRLLHVYKDSGDNAEIDIQSVSGAGNHWAIYHDRGTDDLRFWQGSDRVTFNDDGTVQLAGYADCGTLNTNSSGWITCGAAAGDVSGSGTNNYLAKWTGASTIGASTIYDNGNVGIGTAGPSYKLDVNGAIGTNRNSIQFQPSGGSVATDGSYGIYWHNSSGATPSSNYGIYRTTGAWTASTYQQLRIAFDTGIQLSAGTGVGTGYDKSYVEVVNGKGLMVTSGNVGIGTTNPGEKLEVSGSIKSSNLASAGNRCLYADANGVIKIKTDDCGLASAGGDNLGNHIATSDLNMSDKNITNAGYVYAGNPSYPVRLGELWGHTGLYNGLAGQVMYFGSDQYFQFLNRSGTWGPGVQAQDFYSNAAGVWMSQLCRSDGSNCPDASAANEIQTLGTSGNSITLTSGGSITAPYAVNAAAVPWSGVSSKPTAIDRIQNLTGSHGSINIAGTTGAYAGINFVDEGLILMMDGAGATGVYTGTAWKWYFDVNGALTVGTVPWGRITGAPSFITDDTSVPKNHLANSGTLGFQWSDAEVSDTLTASYAANADTVDGLHASSFCQSGGTNCPSFNDADAQIGNEVVDIFAGKGIQLSGSKSAGYTISTYFADVTQYVLGNDDCSGQRCICNQRTADRVCQIMAKTMAGTAVTYNCGDHGTSQLRNSWNLVNFTWVSQGGGKRWLDSVDCVKIDFSALFEE